MAVGDRNDSGKMKKEEGVIVSQSSCLDVCLQWQKLRTGKYFAASSAKYIASVDGSPRAQRGCIRLGKPYR